MNEAFDYGLEHSAPWPAWVSFLTLALAALFVLAAYFLERSHRNGRLGWRAALAFLRISLVTMIVLMLYRWARQPYQTEPAELVIAIDDSASMGHADRYVEEKLARLASERTGLRTPTRFKLAQSLVLSRDGELLADLSRRYNVKLFFLGDAARQTNVAGDELAGAVNEARPDRPASLLGQGLREILEGQRGRPTAAVVLFTDGATTAGLSTIDAAEMARRAQTPLSIIGLGDPATPRDVWIADLIADDAVFLGDSVQFEARLQASGLRGAKLEARLSLAGGSEVLDRQTIECPADGATVVATLEHRPPAAGDFEYVVQVGPVARELRRDNNERRRRVSVREETIRVLYVQEYPSGDFRYLKNFLSRAEAAGENALRQSFELTTVLQESDPRFSAIDETAGVFPADREELFTYDCVIFGDVNPARLSRQELTNLAAFVSERAGGLALVAGPRHTPLAYRDTPLADLFPIDLATVSATAPSSLTSPVKVRLTKLGEASPMLMLTDNAEASRKVWNELPPLYWILDAPSLKPAARVLLETAGSEARPVLIEQYYGAGKVLFLASDDSWRWRFRAGDRYFGRMWGQMLRDLARAKLRGAGAEVELTSDRKEYRQGEVVSLAARFRDLASAPNADLAPLVLERDDAPPESVTLERSGERRNVFTGEIRDLPAGRYRARLATAPAGDEATAATAEFNIVQPAGELARLEMNAGELQQAARISRGKFYTLVDGDRWARDLPRGPRLRVRPMALEPLWNAPWAAALFISLLVAEWIGRRRLGLL